MPLFETAVGMVIVGDNGAVYVSENAVVDGVKFVVYRATALVILSSSTWNAAAGFT